MSAAAIAFPRFPDRHGGPAIFRPGWSIAFEEEDISRASNWRIHEPGHNVIVHLSGRMVELETELEGRGGSSGPAQPGEVWTVPAGLRYAGSGSGECIRYAVISLHPQCAGAWQHPGTAAWEMTPLAGTYDERLHVLVRRLGRLLALQSEEASMEALECSHQVLRYLRHRYGVAPEAAPGNGRALVFAAPTVRRLRRWIRDRLPECIRLEDLAREAGVTPHQLLIGFRRSFGTTPAQYVIAQRLRAARYLLSTTRKDITTIALEAGFSSHSHLTRAFRAAAGYPPSQFRAKCAAGH